MSHALSNALTRSSGSGPFALLYRSSVRIRAWTKDWAEGLACRCNSGLVERRMMHRVSLRLRELEQCDVGSISALFQSTSTRVFPTNIPISTNFLDSIWLGGRTYGDGFDELESFEVCGLDVALAIEFSEAGADVEATARGTFFGGGRELSCEESSAVICLWVRIFPGGWGEDVLREGVVDE